MKGIIVRSTDSLNLTRKLKSSWDSYDSVTELGIMKELEILVMNLAHYVTGVQVRST